MTEEQQLQASPSLPWERTDASKYHDAHPALGYLYKRAEVEQEGFQCLIEVRQDIDYDWTRDRGTFTNTWEDGAIENPRAKHDRNVFPYFVPEYSREARIRDLIEQGLSQEKASAEAERQLLEDLLLAADPEGQGYSVVWIRVMVSYKGVELAQTNLGGTEIKLGDLDNPYITECALELLGDAVEAAKKKLAELRQA